MTLINALTAFSERHLTEENAWYTWPSGQIPDGITLDEGSCFQQQVALKKALNKIWAAQPERRAELERYYVVTFGGVRGNAQKTMEDYASTTDASEFHARGIAGIATWSKILTARDCSKFAIYDARVAVALNALQIVMQVVDPVFFPHVTSRNIMIHNGQKLLKQKCTDWPRLNAAEFYDTYLKTLQACAMHTPSKFGIETFEMLLFSMAEALLDEAFPGDAAALRAGYKRKK